METKCPHCGKKIELVGAKELADEFSLGSNHVQHAKERGTFPEPYMAFGNRMLYLRKDVQAYTSGRDKESAKKAVEILKRTMSPEQLEKVLEELRA